MDVCSCPIQAALGSSPTAPFAGAGAGQAKKANVPEEMLAWFWLALSPIMGANPLADAKEGPVEFVCESMQLMRNPNRALCNNEVVVRRGEIMLCCDRFEGIMTPEGTWQRLICTKNVRAQRRGEVMWAARAEYVLATNDLILTGSPQLSRGKSILHGERIVVDTKYERAHIEQPRGRLEPEGADGPTPPPLPLIGELPRVCPIPGPPGAK